MSDISIKCIRLEATSVRVLFVVFQVEEDALHVATVVPGSIIQVSMGDAVYKTIPHEWTTEEILNRHVKWIAVMPESNLEEIYEGAFVV